MQDKIKNLLTESIDLKQKVANYLLDNIEHAANVIIEAYRNGKKVLICGNGGSAADAQHMAAELLGRFKKNRKALPALALNANTSVITALANDFGYDMVFEKQVEGLIQAGDILIGISTSGKSKNIVKAIETAKKAGAKTLALTGGGGGTLDQVADFSVSIPSKNTPRIQEAHITIIHIICELVEEALFSA